MSARTPRGSGDGIARCAGRLGPGSDAPTRALVLQRPVGPCTCRCAVSVRSVLASCRTRRTRCRVQAGGSAGRRCCWCGRQRSGGMFSSRRVTARASRTQRRSQRPSPRSLRRRVASSRRSSVASPCEVMLAGVERDGAVFDDVVHDDGPALRDRERAGAGVLHEPSRAADRGNAVSASRAEVAVGVAEKLAPVGRFAQSEPVRARIRTETSGQRA
jgi:hypothetical protein